MGLFSRKKKEEKPEKAQPEKLMLDSPLGTFTYINNPGANEFGYESETRWEQSGRSDPIITVYIDTDSPESTQAGLCYAKLEEIVADQERIDKDITERIADHFLSMPDMIASGYNKQMITDDMELFWLGVFRNGDTQFSYDAAGVYANDITVTIHADGSRKIEYRYRSEMHVDTM